MTRSGERLLNFSTSIDAEKTAYEIESLLGKSGATDIHKEYKEGNVMALMFGIMLPNGRYLGFRMPINVENTLLVFKEQARKGKMPNNKVNIDQARRTAWRILKDWVEVQLAFVESKQVEMERAFFAYILDNQGQTLFDIVAKNNFKGLLPEHKGD